MDGRLCVAEAATLPAAMAGCFALLDRRSGEEEREALARAYSASGDHQGFLVEEARLILRGRLARQLTEEHVEALVAENRSILRVGQYAEVGEVPF